MSTAGTRIALVLGSTLAAALCAWFLWPEEDAGLFEVDSDIEATLEILRNRAEAGTPSEANDGESDEPLSEATARGLFTQLHNHSNQYDPHCFFRYRPNLETRLEYSEHPDGFWRLVTNSHGLRMDADVLVEPPDVRILVTGDSHTDGICNNAEAFPALLAGHLTTGERSVEVLNAGKSGYSLYQYRGVLDTFGDTQPDLFIVCFYGGNDFSEVLAPYHWFERLNPKLRPIGPEKLERARELVPRGVLPQYLMQAAIFNANPELEALATDVALELTRDIDRICRERDLPWIGVYIPPLVEVSEEGLTSGFREAHAALGLDEQALVQHSDAPDLWLAQLADLGVPRLDLRPVLRDAAGPLYWEQDHHLNLHANRIVARALADLVESSLGE